MPPTQPARSEATKRWLRIPRKLLAQVWEHARSQPGDEVCGVLIGNAVDGSVYTVMPGRNLARDPGRHFVLDAGTLLAADSEARAVGQEIVGFYHSHPRSGPAPSPVDYELAWPATVQLIVKVNRGVPAACAWCIEQGLVTPCYFQFLP